MRSFEVHLACPLRLVLVYRGGSSPLWRRRALHIFLAAAVMSDSGVKTSPGFSMAEGQWLAQG
jgi:hypothetical protein